MPVDVPEDLQNKLAGVSDMSEQEKMLWLDRFLLKGKSYRMVREAVGWLMTKRRTAELEGGDNWTDNSIHSRRKGMASWVFALHALEHARKYFPDLYRPDINRLIDADLHVMFRTYANGRINGMPYLRASSELQTNALATLDFTETVCAVADLASCVLGQPTEHDDRVLAISETMLENTVRWISDATIEERRGKVLGWSWFKTDETGLEWADTYWPSHCYFSAEVLRTLLQLYRRRGATPSVHGALITAGLDYDKHIELVEGAAEFLVKRQDKDTGGWLDFPAKAGKRSHKSHVEENADPTISAKVCATLAMAYTDFEFLREARFGVRLKRSIARGVEYLNETVLELGFRDPDLAASLGSELLLIQKPLTRYYVGCCTANTFHAVMRGSECVTHSEKAQRYRERARTVFSTVVKERCWGAVDSIGFRHFEEGGGGQSIAIYETSRSMRILMDNGIERDAGIGLYDIILSQLSQVAERIILDLVGLYKPHEQVGVRIAWGQITSDAQDVARRGAPQASAKKDEAVVHKAIAIVPDAAFFSLVATCKEMIEKSALDDTVSRELSRLYLQGIPEQLRPQVRAFLGRANQTEFTSLLNSLLETAEPEGLQDQLEHYNEEIATSWNDGQEYDLLFATRRSFLDEWLQLPMADKADPKIKMERLISSLERLIEAEGGQRG